MTLSTLKHLVTKLENSGVNDDFNIEICAWDGPKEDVKPCWPNLIAVDIDDSLTFDIGHSDKLVSIDAHMI